MKKRFSILLLAAVSLLAARAQTTRDCLPDIGAQVIIERGQSDEKIDALFKALKENNMSICRIGFTRSHDVCRTQAYFATAGYIAVTLPGNEAWQQGKQHD